MANVTSTAVIGAGPYGLAIASTLQAAGVPVQIFGQPLELWQKMPLGLFLKSVWSASSLTAPQSRYCLDDYLASTGKTRVEPIPLAFFLDYGEWFLQQTSLDIHSTYVQILSRHGRSFHLELANGSHSSADRVIVATGIADFPSIPDYARNLPPELATHTHYLSDLSGFRERRVAIVGSGQSALEYAALLHTAGAEVEVIARKHFIWHSRRLYEHTGPLRPLFYPPGDVGPPGVNWLVASPSLFSHLPTYVKQRLHQRATRPAGAKWLRPRVAEVVRLTPSTQIEQALAHGRTLSLKLSDGTSREVDFLVLGTGYQPDLRRLPFLDALLRDQIQLRAGYPVLNSGCESSVTGLYFAGALASQTLGPTCRFLSGAPALAQRLTRHCIQ